jgi:hypothetical protein
MTSLFDIYAGYLDAMRIEKERDPKRLFVTDVGKCPRQVALRLIGAERKAILPHNKMMWDLAEYIELTLMKALDAEGLLYEYQAPIRISDHENWGGRLDIVQFVADDTLRIDEVKTVRSNSFNYSDRPKRPHEYQGTIYDHYYDYGEHSHVAPVLWYADRGGSNPPEEYEVGCDFALVRPLMDELDAVRDNLPELPKMLPKVCKLASYGKVLKYVPDWQCGYCDYRDVSCHPDMSEETWGELRGTWAWKQKAKLDVVSSWAQQEGKDAILAAL